ncbi:hypothetical protein UPYG_G00242030 [Umbra pygmaea]|uniref:chitinase n=1 Tax=Umbra pygmaea TaxID=75934 RepID=A0ABD0WFK3_UMBPY
MRKLTLVTGLLFSLCLLVPTNTLAASDSFCAGMANGQYAKVDAPQTYYNCANGVTYIQNCPSALVFDVSCTCCNYPKVPAAPPLLPTTIPSQVIPPTINATVGESSFCSGMADGLYATTGAPQSYYSCDNGLTWIQNCPSGFVFDDSFKCCGSS